MKTSDAGIKLIKHFEGTKLVAYKCPAGKWTLGTGSTFWPNGEPVKEGDTVTEEGAEELLKATLSKFEQGIDKVVVVLLNQNQYDALVAFSFNVGVAAFSGSTLLKLLNQKKYLEAANEFPKWNKIAGKVSNGLVRRREAERGLFLQ